MHVLLEPLLAIHISAIATHTLSTNRSWLVYKKTLIQPLTDRYPLRRPLYQTFRVNHEFARISLKYQFVSFLNNLSETNSQLLNTILEHVQIQPFIEYSRFITNYLNSLYT